MAEIDVHFNHKYDDIAPGGLPINLKDRYYSQDLGRDFFWQSNAAAMMALKSAGQQGTNPRIIIEGLSVSQGVGDTINITAGVGIVSNINVLIPDSFASIPPTTKLVKIAVYLRIQVDEINIAIPNATLDGAIINYIYLKYVQNPVKTRTRSKAPGSYPYEQTDKATLVIGIIPPLTDGTELLLGKFKGLPAATFTFDAMAGNEFRTNKQPAQSNRAISVDESESSDVELLIKDPSFQEHRRWLGIPSFTGPPEQTVYINPQAGALPNRLRFDGTGVIQVVTYRRNDTFSHFFRVHKNESYAVVVKMRRSGISNQIRIRFTLYNAVKGIMSILNLGEENLTTTFEYYIFVAKPSDMTNASFFVFQILDLGSPIGTLNSINSIQMYRNPVSFPPAVISRLALSTSIAGIDPEQSGGMSHIELDFTNTFTVSSESFADTNVPNSVAFPFFVKGVRLIIYGTELAAATLGLRYEDNDGTDKIVLLDWVSGGSTITTRNEVRIPVSSYDANGTANIRLRKSTSTSPDVVIIFAGLYLD